MKEIILKNKIINDSYTDYVYSVFDIQNQAETETKIKNNLSEIDSFSWCIGLICGGSGSGKTTLLKTFGTPPEIHFDNSIPIISNFKNLTPKEATQLLSSIGLSSVPTWLRPFDCLSNGEQYRCMLAKKISLANPGDIVLIDEYTSVIDRDVAKAMSNALQKYIRRNKLKIILSSCHYDVIKWLQPDWIYSTMKGRVERPSLARNSRPKIELQIYRCRYKTWQYFKEHHYMSDNLNKASKCFIATWKEKPVAFLAVIPSPSGYIKNAYRCSRIVVFPDFQGLGIGYKFVEFIASMYNEINSPFYIKTSHLPFIERFKNENWIVKKSDQRKYNGNGYEHWKRKTSECFTMKYNGNKSRINTDLITFNASLWKNISQNQISLF
jgi:ABC-type lipoprotein export system ATPase subunit/GNAT superfamily N-acetyltransferase